MSYKAEVIADNSGEFVGNGLRFATIDEAENYAIDLRCRWTAVQKTRVIASTDPISARWEEGHLIHLSR